MPRAAATVVPGVGVTDDFYEFHIVIIVAEYEASCVQACRLPMSACKGLFVHATITLCRA